MGLYLYSMGMGIGMPISAGADLGYWLLYIHCWVAIGLWQVMGRGNWFLALVVDKAGKDWGNV